MSDTLTARSNDFAQTFNTAHGEAGLGRVSIAHILQRIQTDPNFLFSEDFRQGAGQCPFHAGKTEGAAAGAAPIPQDDADKVAVNSLLALLFNRLRDHIAGNLPFDADGRPMLPIRPRSPHGLDPADRDAMAAAAPDVFCSVLRDATCHLLDGLITGWAVDLVKEEEYFRSQGSGAISLEAAATFVLRTVLEHSPLYQRAGYDMLSITKTGSHTAIHICWAMVEAAPLLVPGRDAAFYDDLVHRSLKQIVPLSMASLGMLVHYMEESGIEPPDGLAVHRLPKDQTAFVLDANGLIRLNADPIVTFAKPGERYYTGCPAFYTTNLIKLYLDIVAGLALDYSVYDRLQEG
ncbi:hypothetical protein TSH100_05370 [Azospirillum sp. TSH100]|uniref:hypothetical protein n=1 Tax=Azospirillum sp. TSH100 TaxID=652764 RepID=UPI000D616C2A|nr:hypothetical protein [Azospirillum sp. TSH100]PWC89463.1 hypothetical protein TSH100_05370 [Azospirillum sp. TSH100]QCG90178.1 hypothetical protein E6C72_20755 [Azospirillum sp. TSH100]